VTKEPFAVITKRGNSWRAIVYIGRDPLTGRECQKTGTAKTRAEAKQLEARLITEAGAGRHRNTGTKTVADLLEAWYQWRPGARPISPNTLANYRRYMHQDPPCAWQSPVARLEAATLDRFYSELRQRGSKCQHCYRRMRDGEPPMRQGEVFRLRFTGKEVVHETDCVQGLPMSASALRDVHAILSGAFKQAMRWGWITQNPVPLAAAPANEQADVQPPDVKQVERPVGDRHRGGPRAGSIPRRSRCHRCGARDGAGHL
jgi:integrase